MIKIGIKLTNEDYDKSIINSQLVRLDEYVNTNTAISHRCKICNNIINISPKSIKNGSRCKCQHKRIYKNRLSNEEYINKLIYTNYISIDKYISANIPINHVCKSCRTIKSMKPSNAIHNIGCIECNRLKYKREYLDKLKLTDIELIDEYINSKTKIKHKCKLCNNIWYIKPNDISHGVRCNLCTISKGEEKIRKYLETNNIDFQREKIFKKLPKYRFDFYIPMYNICIEFDGIQHFKPIEYFGGVKYFENVKLNDRIKNEFCEINKIYLFRIPYKDIDKIDKILSKIELFT